MILLEKRKKKKRSYQDEGCLSEGTNSIRNFLEHSTFRVWRRSVAACSPCWLTVSLPTVLGDQEVFSYARIGKWLLGRLSLRNGTCGFFSILFYFFYPFIFYTLLHQSAQQNCYCPALQPCSTVQKGNLDKFCLPTFKKKASAHQLLALRLNAFSP